MDDLSVKTSVREVLDSAEFRGLVARRWRVSLRADRAAVRPVLRLHHPDCDQPAAACRVRVSGVDDGRDPDCGRRDRRRLGADRARTSSGRTATTIRRVARLRGARAGGLTACRRRLGTPDAVGDRVVPRHRRADAGGDVLGGAPHAIDERVLRRRPIDQPTPERARARGRLHERGVVPRHHRAGRAARLRRDDLRDRVARRLAGADVPRSPSRCAISASSRSPTSSRSGCGRCRCASPRRSAES